MDLGEFSREELIVAGIALLLAIDLLLFLPWFSVTVALGSFSASATSTATGAPDGWLGVLAVLALLGLVADLALAGIDGAAVPALGGSRQPVRLRLLGCGGANRRAGRAGGAQTRARVLIRI